MTLRSETMATVKVTPESDPALAPSPEITPVFAVRTTPVDTTAGVRAHPSYDHPGNVYLIEATRKVRVASGYDTPAAALKFCKTQGWRWLGIMPVKSPAYEIGRKAHRANLAAQRASAAETQS